MKKRLSAVLLCLVMLLPLCGCHGSKARIAFAVPASFDSSRPYEISFWAKNDTNKTQTAIYQKAIRDFEALYPNITVNLRLYTDYGKIYNDVITNIATDTTPNVCVTYPDHIATYMTGTDVVVPLDDLFADPNFGFGGKELRYDGPAADELIEEFMTECRIGAISYAVPYMRSTEACYINKTMLEKLGYELPDILTWDFVWEVSDLAARKDAEGNYAVNGQKVMIPFLYKSTDNMMIQYLRQKDAGYSTPNGDIRTTRRPFWTPLPNMWGRAPFPPSRSRPTRQTSSTPVSAFSRWTPQPALPGWAATPRSLTSRRTSWSALRPPCGPFRSSTLKIPP